MMVCKIGKRKHTEQKDKRTRKNESNAMHKGIIGIIYFVLRRGTERKIGPNNPAPEEAYYVFHHYSLIFQDSTVCHNTLKNNYVNIKRNDRARVRSRKNIYSSIRFWICSESRSSTCACLRFSISSRTRVKSSTCFLIARSRDLSFREFAFTISLSIIKLLCKIKNIRCSNDHKNLLSPSIYFSVLIIMRFIKKKRPVIKIGRNINGCYFGPYL